MKFLRGTRAERFTKAEAIFTLKNAALLLCWDRQNHQMVPDVDEDTWAAVQLLVEQAELLGRPTKVGFYFRRAK